jgi:hypothetical protein
LATARATAQDQAAKAITFREAARRFIDSHSTTWRNSKHAGQSSSTIETYAIPIFGDVSIAEVRRRGRGGRKRAPRIGVSNQILRDSSPLTAARLEIPPS